MVLMLRHHMHKTVLTEGWRYVYLYYSYKHICSRSGENLLFSIYVSHKNKLIRTGWTHLVEFLCSSCKLLVPDLLWFLVPVRALPRSCFGIYTHNTGLEARGPLCVI